MRQQTEALVLGIVRYSDSTDIATLYTRELGRVSALFSSPRGRRRSTTPPLMPLSLIEGELSARNAGAFYRLGRYSLSDPLAALRADPVKTAVGMFVAEFLSRLLREQAPDGSLWRAVTTALNILDAERNKQRIANFHIVMLWQLLAPSGIMPDTNSYDPGYRGEQWLDMRTGQYTSVKPPHGDVVAPCYAGVPLMLSRLNFRNSACLRITGEQRYHLADALLHYYAVHLPGLGTLNSHHVLRTIFS